MNPVASTVKKPKKPEKTASFRDELNSVRVRAGMSELELAEWLGGISKTTLGSWARGEREPRWFTMEKLRKALAYLNMELDRKESRLPLPLGVRKDDRLAHIRDIRKNYPSV